MDIAFVPHKIIYYVGVIRTEVILQAWPVFVIVTMVTKAT